MRSLPCYLLLILPIVVSYAAEFKFKVKSNRSPKQMISSGYRHLNAIATIPDMFMKSNNKRRLKESTEKPTPAATPAPTTKVMLPVIMLIHAEGAQDRSHSLYGSQFNMNPLYRGKIFDDLKTKLVSNGKMAVVQYDKRNCKSSANNPNDLSQPLCADLCPNYCPNTASSCYDLSGVCYNDHNITVNDIIKDAQSVFTQSINIITNHTDSNIVDINRIWSIPIGFSFQGAAIATYIASTNTYHNNIWPTAISLMGAGISIDKLLQMQLTNEMNNMNHSQTDMIHKMQNDIQILNNNFQGIRDGTLADNDTVYIQNNFLDENESKYVSYWRDWLDVTANTPYNEIVNFMAINSGNDVFVSSEAYKPLRDMFASNTTVEMITLQNINHYMIDSTDWQKGKWKVDDKVSEHIINFVNDISGYLDDINQWIVLNKSNHSTIISGGGNVLVENDTVYKVLLYTSIMAIVFILACGIYWVIAKKVCPYEFEDINLDENARAEERERERERRRRHRRRRHRRHRRSQHRNSNYRNMVELNEPMIQSAMNNVLLNENENSQNINQNHENENQNENGNENNNANDNIDNIEMSEQTQTQNQVLNEYVD